MYGTFLDKVKGVVVDDHVVPELELKRLSGEGLEPVMLDPHRGDGGRNGSLLGDGLDLGVGEVEGGHAGHHRPL